jgi:hypothetical protein
MADFIANYDSGSQSLDDDSYYWMMINPKEEGR